MFILSMLTTVTDLDVNFDQQFYLIYYIEITSHKAF